MKLENQIAIIGELEITERYTDTGEIIGHFKDHNVFLDQGKAEIFRAFSEVDSNDHIVQTIKIGDDVGVGGTVLNPAPATPDMTEGAQNVVYSTPLQEFFFEYPEQKEVRYLATINGANVMSDYSTQPNVIYSSAAIYLQNGKAVAYRRFPSRTISSLISVDISWTLRIP